METYPTWYENAADDGAQERRRTLADKGLGDFADLVAETYGQQDIDAALDAFEHRHPSAGAAAEGHSFDLGAYYDRIGLAREEAASLSRLLEADARKRAGGAATERGLDADLFRLESLLATLDIDLELDDLRQEAGARISSSCVSDRCPQDACAVDAAIEAAGHRLRDALASMESAAEAPERVIAVAEGGRMALVLDKALTHQLRAAAAAEAVRPEAYLAARLNEAFRAS